MDFLTNRKDIQAWLDAYCTIKGETIIHDDGSVSIMGNIAISKLGSPRLVTRLAVQFKNVTGNFICDDMPLVALAGAPSTVGGNFSCWQCTALTSLQGAPQVVGGNFNCSNCAVLESLQGGPQTVGRTFYCSACALLTNLHGAPATVGEAFYCRSLNITTLDGAPQRIENDIFDCSDCKNLVTLQGLPAYVGGDVFAHNCSALQSLDGLNIVKHSVCIDTIPKPTPDQLQLFIRNKLHFSATQSSQRKAKWLQIVNDYRKSGDLLTAIAAFEKYCRIPYSTFCAPAQNPEAILDLPTL